MDMHETAIATMMCVRVRGGRGLVLVVGGSGDSPGDAFLLGIVS